MAKGVVNQPIAAELVLLASSVGVQLSAVYQELGVTDVQFLHWRKDHNRPGRGDVLHMQVLIAVINELLNGGQLSVGSKSRLKRYDATRIFKRATESKIVKVIVPFMERKRL